MKIIFLGTPEIAVKSLEALNKDHEIVCVITRPDRASGRSGTPEPSPIAALSSELGLNCIKPDKLDDSLIEYLKSLNAQYFVTFAYGKIFRKEFLEIAEKGGINIHPSLLPEYRGPSPIQSAIADGKKYSGITVQKIALEVDSGDVLNTVLFEIKPSDDVVTIESLVCEKSAVLISETLSGIDNITPLPQDGSKAVYCRIIEKKDGLIDWNNTAESIFNKVRAYVKWPVCSTVFNGKKLNILQAEVCTDFENDQSACGTVLKADKKDGVIVKCGNNTALKLLKLQLQGKKILDYKDFVNGVRDMAGCILG